MFILNVTPDSFSDGGRYADTGAAADAAARAVTDGACIIDIGGESTRPGARSVSSADQAARVVPVIRAIRAMRSEAANVIITVDTTLSDVARAALDAGADAINDVSAGTDDSMMFALAAERGAGVIVMHRAARPRDDRYSDRHESPLMTGDVVSTVREYLRERAAAAEAAGIAADVRDGATSLVVDPGLGFGKTVEQNITLLHRTTEIAEGRPVLSALSRKSFVGRVSLQRDSEPSERLAGTLALTLAHYEAGARIFRVHDVAPLAEALRAWGAQ